jgi:hypothetical protein
MYKVRQEDEHNQKAYFLACYDCNGFREEAKRKGCAWYITQRQYDKEHEILEIK